MAREQQKVSAEAEEIAWRFRRAKQRRGGPSEGLGRFVRVVFASVFASYPQPRRFGERGVVFASGVPVEKRVEAETFLPFFFGLRDFPDVVSQRIGNARRVRVSGGVRYAGRHGRYRDFAKGLVDVRGFGGDVRRQKLGERRERHAYSSARGELVRHLAAAFRLERRVTRQPGAVSCKRDERTRRRARARQRPGGQAGRVRVHSTRRGRLFFFFFFFFRRGGQKARFLARARRVAEIHRLRRECRRRGSRSRTGVERRRQRLRSRSRKRKRRRVFVFGRDGACRARRQEKPHDVHDAVRTLLLLLRRSGRNIKDVFHERTQRHLREAEVGVAADARRVPRSVHAGGASDFLAVAHPHAAHHLVRERE
mmetsp:Transcript_15714/g.66203  ORF Transcript_15714/g.66203 Transcript_15714/m.66203 type:complete len:367 (+) Transcript_15714:1336-2436(+)